MKIRLIQNVDGEFVTNEFEEDNAIAAMEVRGFAFVRLNQNKRQRAELEGAPVFTGLCGPMWDGDAIRYEDQRSYDILST